MRSFFFLLFPLTLMAAPFKGGAPDFLGKDSLGKDHKLSEFKGKFVVLEWHNQNCPFVKKHYETKHMQKLQKDLTKNGVAWFTVISSAKGKQGFVTPEESTQYVKKMEASPTAVLLDTEGRLGNLYGARTTPHMFLIDPKGNLIYQGAIDDKSSTDKETVASAKNYLVAAWEEAKAGKPVTEPATEPYGCGVKY